MEAIGAVSSIFAIYNQLEKCGKRLHRLKHNFRIAKQELNLLADEVSSCQSLFGIFSHISRPLDNKVMKLARQQQLEETLNSQATFAFGQIGEIFLRLEPLREHSNAGRFDQIIAKLRWHWMKDEVQLPLLTLVSVKITLTAFNCLLILDLCLRDMKSPSVSKNEMKSLKMQM
ncbi:hypothetical protein N7478_012313 [Penicillium angulare]|uniref:uncharacterized protein n=1 Tax=Penicillium angulare TaxID=116970 RepID=UPI002540B890|nr:uncharacterized protein N7478_012313 [Penicillium angulare]KAJ5259332.1 hypothetical protein N7478_012313 [Penicillium angulare]